MRPEPTACRRPSAFGDPPRLRLARPVWAIAFLLGCSVAGLASDARGADGEWSVDLDRSVLALLTEKGGFAKGHAHDHLIVARDVEVTLHWSGDETTAEFGVDLEASALDPDPDGPRQRLAPRLAELGLRDGELTPITQKQRTKIREAMLGADQLDAERFPRISVELVEVRVSPSRAGTVDMTHRGLVSFSAHGRTVELPFRARLTESTHTLTVEAIAPLRFTAIGIEPYSAFLGAVKNLDQTTLYLLLQARRAMPGGASVR